MPFGLSDEHGYILDLNTDIDGNGFVDGLLAWSEAPKEGNQVWHHAIYLGSDTGFCISSENEAAKQYREQNFPGYTAEQCVDKSGYELPFGMWYSDDSHPIALEVMTLIDLNGDSKPDGLLGWLLNDVWYSALYINTGASFCIDSENLAAKEYRLANFSASTTMSLCPTKNHYVLPFGLSAFGGQVMHMEDANDDLLVDALLGWYDGMVYGRLPKPWPCCG